MTPSPSTLLSRKLEPPQHVQNILVASHEIEVKDRLYMGAAAVGVMRDREHWSIEIVGALLGLIVAGLAIVLGAIAIASMYCVSAFDRIAHWIRRAPT